MYPPPSPYDPRAEAERQKAGLFKAGKVAAWVWVSLTVAAVVIVVGCCGLCLFGGVLGVVMPTGTPTPTP
ncbi:hypothetical protein DER29_0515 [Micromonospora sp. M71_S20]|uniref:hypothetical protein n=1 Tax=Micromonospora sp. M71_S20 TaxID=592872 RepID=UPI000EB4F76D|nr:hypothetical protein [Micromonospora sp. M71_S20]RLK22676.1 hypothetical protein DER29_0515 [Micromonospora sp. M71_S20]